MKNIRILLHYIHCILIFKYKSNFTQHLYVIYKNQLPYVLWRHYLRTPWPIWLMFFLFCSKLSGQNFNVDEKIKKKRKCPFLYCTVRYAYLFQKMTMNFLHRNWGISSVRFYGVRRCSTVLGLLISRSFCIYSVVKT